jgi:hypothetical protein
MKLEVLWRQLIGIGAEHMVLDVDDEVRADGLAVGEIRSTAYRVHYELVCDTKWNFRQLTIRDLVSGRGFHVMRLHDGRWLDETDHEIAGLTGCTDVDIMITPFTNTLPIRRLTWELAQSREIAVAYIGVPDLSISRMDQRYTCLAQHENGGAFRYENLRSGFTAELKVDRDGLVVDYPNIFSMDAKRRLAAS